MEAKELRLGNYVKFPNNDKPLIVNHRIIHDLLLGTSIYEEIPLTEEWLLKYDFIKDFYRINDPTIPDSFIEDYIWHLEGEIYLSTKYNIWWLMNEYDGLLSFKREIKGLHDLQNLYFALTGKELYLKEN